MFILFLCFVLLCLWKMRPRLHGFHEDYLSVEKTASVKGIFALTVCFSHFLWYCLPQLKNPWDLRLEHFLHTVIGQMMVTLFLFYSGFGVMESIRKKGRPYVKSLPKKRVLKVLLDFDLAVCAFALLYALTKGMPTLSQLLTSFLAWEAPFGNSDWYIFAILWGYLLTFFAFFIAKDRHFAGALLLTALSVLYYAALRQFKPIYWCDTYFCYVLGVWYSLLREKLEKLICRSDLMWLLSFGLSLAGWYLCWKRDWSVPCHLAKMLFFTLGVVIFTMKVSLHNPALEKLGKLTFGIYILQRIPMLLCNHFGLTARLPVAAFLLSVAVTVPLAAAYQRLTAKWSKKLLQ